MSASEKLLLSYAKSFESEPKIEESKFELRSFRTLPATLCYDATLNGWLKELKHSEEDCLYSPFWLTATSKEELDEASEAIKRDFPRNACVSKEFSINGGFARLYVLMSSGVATRAARSNSLFVTELVNTLTTLLPVPENVKVSVASKVARKKAGIRPKKTYAPRILIKKPTANRRRTEKDQ